MPEFRYRAVTNGTLSNPYRHVKAGDLVVLSEPLAKPSKWLLPEPEAHAVLSNELPVMPYMTKPGSELKKVLVAPVTQTSSYSQGIESLKALEALADAKAKGETKVELTGPALEAPTMTQGEQGTGNQEVL